MDFLYPGLLFLALVVAVAAGRSMRRVLDERHLSQDSVETIRLFMGMLLTFSALVLGLLTSSAKARFDGFNHDLSVYSADLIELDHRLRDYGAEADGIRAQLRRYTAAAIADTWPEETPPAGQYPRLVQPADPRNLEGTSLGDMLFAMDMEIERLAPADAFHRQIAARLRDRVADVIQQRWRLILSSGSTISWPFLIVLTAWLTIIFAIFGLTSPANGLIYVVVGLSALSIASPLYLIIDYDDALAGLLKLSSTSMRVALSHMDAS